MIRLTRRFAAPAAALVLVALLGPGCAGGRGPGADPTAGPPSTAGPTTTPAPSQPPTGPPPPPPPPPPAPPPGVPSSLLGKDVEQIPTGDRVVALTFDAGANANAVPSILATLAAERITATFFLTGAFVRNFPGATQSIVDAGHRLANHSDTHPDFTTLSGSQIRDQVRTAEQDIRSAGADPRPLFRFPYGARDARTITAVNDLGYVPVRWTVDSLGWQGTSGGRSAAEVIQRVLSTARPGQIVLMHVGSHPTDGSTLDADALPGMIAGLRQQGYTFVTLDRLL
jgi:peptidoglycan/xylan/chitin deacetylase (PgdA/CDA1 family)